MFIFLLFLILFKFADCQNFTDSQLLIIEGDILIDTTVGKIGSAIKDKSRLWPKTIPYAISFGFSPDEVKIIENALKDIEDKTCLNFVKHTNQRDYINFFSGNGCYSPVGKVGGKQSVSLGPGCIWHGIVIHETLHSLGFWHEQSRTDRDAYVTILWQNIWPGKEGNFQKYNTNNLNLPYDIFSIMHYESYAFSKNGKKTIIAKSDPSILLKNSAFKEFGGLDVKKLNALYCEETTLPSQCVDILDEYCKGWSNYCSDNFVVRACQKTCDTCNNNYTDESRCSYWASIGECERNNLYMKVMCKNSCS